MHRVLVVGAGSIGERHVRCLCQTGRAEVSISEPHDERRREVAGRYSLESAYSDLESVLEVRHDAAVIATPAQLHISIATRLAAAGCHLLIEKPLSTTLDGIDDLSAIARQRRLVIAVAYVYRAHAALQAMRQAIGAARFGTPVQIVAHSGQHFPTYRPAYREIYYADHASGGGAIQDALTHLLNAGEFLVGPLDRVMADAAHRVLEGVTVEDTVHLLARHGTVLGSYSLNQYQAPNETSITVVCQSGTARFDLQAANWRWMTEPGGAWHEEPACCRDRDALFTAQANAFLDAIEGRAAPLCSLREGLQTLRANLAVLAASRSGAWTRILHGDATSTELGPDR